MGGAAAGGSSGAEQSGGSGGRLPDDPDAGAVSFQASLQGESVVLTASRPVLFPVCNESFWMVRRSADGWERLRDDRPAGSNRHFAEHYLDGEHQSACGLSLGCDYAGCASLSEGNEDLRTFSLDRLVAREYVRVDERPAVSCDAGAPASPDAAPDATAPDGAAPDAGGEVGEGMVPDIESRNPDGELGVELRYYRRSCGSELVTIVVPTE